MYSWLTPCRGVSVPSNESVDFWRALRVEEAEQVGDYFDGRSWSSFFCFFPSILFFSLIDSNKISFKISNLLLSFFSFILLGKAEKNKQNLGLIFRWYQTKMVNLGIIVNKRLSYSQCLDFFWHQGQYWGEKKRRQQAESQDLDKKIEDLLLINDNEQKKVFVLCSAFTRQCGRLISGNFGRFRQ